MVQNVRQNPPAVLRCARCPRNRFCFTRERPGRGCTGQRLNQREDGPTRLPRQTAHLLLLREDAMEPQGGVRHGPIRDTGERDVAGSDAEIVHLPLHRVFEGLLQWISRIRLAHRGHVGLPQSVQVVVDQQRRDAHAFLGPFAVDGLERGGGPDVGRQLSALGYEQVQAHVPNGHGV